MVDTLTTERRSNVLARIGRLLSQQMVELERLTMTLGRGTVSSESVAARNQQARFVCPHQAGSTS